MNLIITHNEYFITINNYEADLLGINSKKGKRYKTARLFHILNCILDLAGIIHMNKQYKLKIQKSKD